VAGHGYRAKGFSHHLIEVIDRRCRVIVGLYQKQIAATPVEDRHTKHDSVLEGYLDEFHDVEAVRNGQPFQKRITHEAAQQSES
jgi:hypothetical protein